MEERYITDLTTAKQSIKKHDNTNEVRCTGKTTEHKIYKYKVILYILNVDSTISDRKRIENY